MLMSPADLQNFPSFSEHGTSGSHKVVLTAYVSACNMLEQVWLLVSSCISELDMCG